MPHQTQIAELENFRHLLAEYDDAPVGERAQFLRRQLNQRKQGVKSLLMQTRVHKTYSIHPAPIFGGPVYANADPIDHIFNPPHGESLNPTLLDMIDEAIGVFQSGQVPAPRPLKASVSEDYREGYAFVAMAIDPNEPGLVDVLDAIKDAAGECGIIAERIDEQTSNERITDRILESIRSAEFIVVDLTHAKPNVFYEAGFAQGLGKIPVYIARAGTKAEFDIKDYPIIYFENLRVLREQLKARLEALAVARRASI